MNLDVALRRLDELADATPALLPGPALGLRTGVDLPYPTTQVLFHDQIEACDGDRARRREGWPARGQDPRPRWRVLHRGDGGQDEA